jgi:hypothetical protein
LKHGRVVGRHRMDHRLLVVGLHKLPPPWDTHGTSQQQQQQQQQQEGPVSALTASPTAATATSCRSGRSSLSLSSSNSSSSSGRGGLGATCSQLDDLLLASWLPTQKRMSSMEGVGLGPSR